MLFLHVSASKVIPAVTTVKGHKRYSFCIFSLSRFYCENQLDLKIAVAAELHTRPSCSNRSNTRMEKKKTGGKATDLGKGLWDLIQRES